VIKNTLDLKINNLNTFRENSELALKFAGRPQMMTILINCAESDDNSLALSAG